MTTRTRTLAVGVTTLVALALATYAVAALEAGPVASYTGCLKNGKIESVAVGDTPLAPCGPGQPQVRLSGGDVTAVTAGAGLAGGGESGDLRLAVDPATVQSRVTAQCERNLSGPIDASISAIRQNGSVVCNPDDTGPSTDVFAGFYDGPLTLPSGFPAKPIAKLALPAGKYAISAKLDVEAGPDAVRLVQCELQAGPDFDKATADLDWPADAFGELALQVVHEFTTPSDVVVSCGGYGDVGQWSNLKVTAVRVATLSNGPLQVFSP